MISKKSQVTIFILLGIVILIAAIFIFYFEEEKAGEVEITQPELMPIKSYIEGCLNIVAEDGIRILGINGGYITFPDEINANPMSHLPTIMKEAKIPFWWYDGINNIPTEDFIKQQVSGYVERELKNCLADFGNLKNQFEIKELEKIKVTTYLNEEDVRIEANYPLEINYRLNKTETRVSKFKTTVPIRLKKAYGLAKDIMNAENRDSFIEKKTIDLMSMDEKIPLTGIDITCEQKTWNIVDIIKRLQELLRVNIPYIKVIGTEFDENMFVPTPYGDTYKDSYYNYHYKWRISEKQYPGMHAAFIYDEKWPIRISARPSDGNVLRSNAQKGFNELSFLCLHIWHFTYDVIYPVRVSVIDEKTEKHDSYLFNLAFKVSIDHNYPNRANFARTAYETIPAETSEDFCNDVSKEITVYTADKETNEEVPGVNLTFTCGRFKCGMGQSDWLSYGAAAGVTKVLPYCVLAVLRGNKQGYEQAEMFIQSDVEGQSYTMYLTPVKEITKYSVVKHPSSNTLSEENIKGNEKATIMIKSGDYEAYAVYPPDGELPIKLFSKNDFTYNLTIYLMDGDKLTGGYQAEWNVGWAELEDADEIKFHVIEKDTGSDTEKYLFIANLGPNSENIPKPELR